MLAARNGKGFQHASGWREELLAITPAQAGACRQRLQALYRQAIPGGGPSSAPGDPPSPNGVRKRPAAAACWHGEGTENILKRPAAEPSVQGAARAADAAAGGITRRPAAAEGTRSLAPKQNQHRQGSRGSSAPHEWRAPYTGAKRLRKGRHFRELEEESLGEFFAMSDGQADAACRKYNLLPPH